MKRVTGIGGIFFKAQDPKSLKAWYHEHLGLAPKADGCVTFEWREAGDSQRQGYTVWEAFPRDTRYFDPSGASFMINYRVDDLDGLLEQLRSEGVEIERREDSEFGRFAWIMDPEGNRIELWEPPSTPATPGPAE